MFADGLDAGVREREASSQNIGRLELFHLWWWAGFQAATGGKLSGSYVLVLVIQHKRLH